MKDSKFISYTKKETERFRKLVLKEEKWQADDSNYGYLEIWW